MHNGHINNNEKPGIENINYKYILKMEN